MTLRTNVWYLYNVNVNKFLFKYYFKLQLLSKTYKTLQYKYKYLQIKCMIALTESINRD